MTIDVYFDFAAIPTPSVIEIKNSHPSENGDNAEKKTGNLNTENDDGGYGGGDSKEGNSKDVDVDER